MNCDRCFTQKLFIMVDFTIPFKQSCNGCDFTCIQNMCERKRLPFKRIENGEVIFHEALTPAQQDEFKADMAAIHFEMIDRKAILTVSKIESFAIQWMQRDSETETRNCSDFLGDKLCLTYNYISDFYAAETKDTIKQFCIQHTIKRAKKMLKNPRWTLEDIAEALHYSSKQHFCTQFKKVTGITPEAYRRAALRKRRRDRFCLAIANIRKKYNFSRKTCND